MCINRKLLIGAAILAIFALSVPAAFAQGLPGGDVDPNLVDKFVTPLVIPPAMPNAGNAPGGADYYEIAVAQFEQQILPASDTDNWDPTTVWSYGPYADFDASIGEGMPVPSGRFFYPAFTVEAQYRKPIWVKWINALVDGGNNFRPHLLPVDPTLHWANPPGGLDYRDTRPDFTGMDTPGPYTGPVPMSVHVHGAHTGEEYDGYAEAWWLPDANNIPAGYATTGTFFDYFNSKYRLTQRGRFAWGNGAASFNYSNNQRATTLWYHDHTLGMTRTNVYAGPAGFWLIRGGSDDLVRKTTGGIATLPGPAPDENTNPVDHTLDNPTVFEIPVAIQDRSFDNNGADLFYPDTREFFDGFAGPYIPEGTVPGDGVDLPSDIAPIWQPEFFGNHMVVNGQTWPFMNVQQRRYRFRFLNGCNSRFLLLKLTTNPRTNDTSFNTANLGTMYQIGAEGGFLPQPVQLTEILMGLAERADVIIDFSQYNEGDRVYLVNDAPDAPFGGIPTPPLVWPDDISHYRTTGLVMTFEVGAAPAGGDPSTPVNELILPNVNGFRQNQIANATLRNLLLFEGESELLCWDEEDPTSVVEQVGGVCPGGTFPVAPKEALLGTGGAGGIGGTPLLWSDGITENPMVGDTEIWRFNNTTADAHPIHVHQVMFQVLGREPFGGGTSVAGSNNPLPTEMGWKDTVISYPDEQTDIIAKFDLPGFYVWHCHIVEHEDNEMMRPFHVGPIPADAPAQ